jgi:hypothetical protein
MTKRRPLDLCLPLSWLEQFRDFISIGELNAEIRNWHVPRHDGLKWEYISRLDLEPRWPIVKELLRKSPDELDGKSLLEMSLDEMRRCKVVHREQQEGDRAEAAATATEVAGNKDTLPTAAVADLAPGDSEPAAGKKRVKRSAPDRFGESDRALFPDLIKLMKDDHLSAQEAAGRLGDLNKIAGRGTLDSRKRHLARRYPAAPLVIVFPLWN